MKDQDPDIEKAKAFLLGFYRNNKSLTVMTGSTLAFLVVWHTVAWMVPTLLTCLAVMTGAVLGCRFVKHALEFFESLGGKDE